MQSSSIAFVLLFFSACKAFNFQGATKPLGFFDPLGFSKDVSNSDLLRLRESELKHGRVGMISALTIPLIERFDHSPAIHQFEHLHPSLQLGIVFSIMAAEVTFMRAGWKDPFASSDNYFQLLDDYQPGDLGLCLPVDDDMLNKELNNGRLAMIASAGMIAQEVVTGQPLF